MHRHPVTIPDHPLQPPTAASPDNTQNTYLCLTAYQPTLQPPDPTTASPTCHAVPFRGPVPRPPSCSPYAAPSHVISQPAPIPPGIRHASATSGDPRDRLAARTEAARGGRGYRGIGSRSGSQLVSVGGRPCDGYAGSAEERTLGFWVAEARQRSTVSVVIAWPGGLGRAVVAGLGEGWWLGRLCKVDETGSSCR